MYTMYIYRNPIFIFFHVITLIVGISVWVMWIVSFVVSIN